MNTTKTNKRRRIKKKSMKTKRRYKKSRFIGGNWPTHLFIFPPSITKEEVDQILNANTKDEQKLDALKAKNDIYMNLFMPSQNLRGSNSIGKNTTANNQIFYNNINKKIKQTPLHGFNNNYKVKEVIETEINKKPVLIFLTNDAINDDNTEHGNGYTTDAESDDNDD